MRISRRTVLKAGVAASAAAARVCMIRRARAASSTTTMKAVMQGDLRSFDPSWTTANITAYYGAMVYDTLFSTDTNFQSQPQMVGKRGVSDDKRTYTFELRDGLIWQDNTPVTAWTALLRSGAGRCATAAAN